MKLTNKKSRGLNQMRTALDGTTIERPIDSSKVLHILRNQPELKIATTPSTSRIEEIEKLEIEVELKRDQGRTYAAFFPPR